MKVIVTYMSQTGNTKKVAEAIFQEIKGKKEIKPSPEPAPVMMATLPRSLMLKPPEMLSCSATFCVDEFTASLP